MPNSALLLVQPRRYPEDERNILREDEIAALPTEEERRREVRHSNPGWS